ncbi:hypothetical protein DFP72DRAFT_1163373 [Ephemerocybe angulata]|uniref:Uncharacterized protein n=1 Tax=Ephemerocybe angulata TaxID=980116 RepID=A0A8H6IHC3_9AGAR|nr:hypothetical protein DFP72DRAFT_1163373 [Tulosesus angulatus]
MDWPSAHPQNPASRPQLHYATSLVSSAASFRIALIDTDSPTSSVHTVTKEKLVETQPDDVDMPHLAEVVEQHADQIRSELFKQQQQQEAEAAFTRRGSRDSQQDRPLVRNSSVRTMLTTTCSRGSVSVVSRCQAVIQRPLTNDDFPARHTFSFDIVGNELTPSILYFSRGYRIPGRRNTLKYLRENASSICSSIKSQVKAGAHSPESIAIRETIRPSNPKRLGESSRTGGCDPS